MASKLAASEMLRLAREDAGLSIAELAGRAGVAVSTVARIERGTTDPGIQTLVKLLRAADAELVLTYERTRPKAGKPAPRTDLASIAELWRRKRIGAHPDLTVLRGLLDSLGDDQVAARKAIERRPPATRSKTLDALLAGIADKVADDHGLLRPAWTKAAPALQREWSTPTTPARLQRRRELTPPQLAARKVIVDEASLWRVRVSADV